MNQPGDVVREKLVEIHRAANEVQANLLADHLRAQGIVVTLSPSPAARAVQAGYCDLDMTIPLLVLENDAVRAGELVTEFLHASAEEPVVTSRRLDKEKIAELRTALKEERRTFEFLGWMGVAFLGAVMVLQQIPIPGLRLSLLIFLVVLALGVGWSLRRRL